MEDYIDLSEEEIDKLVKQYSKKYSISNDWLREYDKKVLLAERKEKLKKLNGRTNLNN